MNFDNVALSFRFWFSSTLSAFVWMIIEKKAWKVFNKAKKEATKERAGDAVEDAVEGAKDLGRAHRGLGGEGI